MTDDELERKLNELTPENLLSIFRALLLCEISLNHVENGSPEVGGQLVDAFDKVTAVGDILESDFGGGIPGESADVGMSRAA